MSLEPISREELRAAMLAYFSEVRANAQIAVVDGRGVYVADAPTSLLEPDELHLFDKLGGGVGVLVGIALAAAVFEARALDNAYQRPAQRTIWERIKGVFA